LSCDWIAAEGGYLTRIESEQFAVLGTELLALLAHLHIWGFLESLPLVIFPVASRARGSCVSVAALQLPTQIGNLKFEHTRLQNLRVQARSLCPQLLHEAEVQLIGFFLALTITQLLSNKLKFLSLFFFTFVLFLSMNLLLYVTFKISLIFLDLSNGGLPELVELGKIFEVEDGWIVIVNFYVGQLTAALLLYHFFHLFTASKVSRLQVVLESLQLSCSSLC
jgi:hypothetical protein